MTDSRPWPTLVLLIAMVAASVCASDKVFAEENLPQSEILELQVQPERIELAGASRQQQLLITAQYADGRLLDVTHRAKLSVENGQVATLAGTTVMGQANGATTLLVSHAGLKRRVPVVIEDFDHYPPIHFAGDIMPVFTKLGCNSGGCHGKQSGQGGFKLSVFGFDPEADYAAILKEGRGRRVFPASIERSLLLTKPLAHVPHGGGKRLQEDSREHELLRQWLWQGMPWGNDSAPHAVRIEVTPSARVVEFNGQQQLQVTAIYNDGTLRDVTAAAIFSSNAAEVAEVDEHGVVQVGRQPGEAAVTVSFLEHVSVARVQVPRPGGPLEVARPALASAIDEHVWTKLENMRIEPSGVCDDATYLRRVSLDLLGTLPTPGEVREFLGDSSPHKRERLASRLLQRPEFADYWALNFADILLVDQDKLGDRGAYEFHHWLRQQFADNRPYDKWVAELITASGNSGVEGPVNFYRALRTPEEAAQAVSQAFLGVRLECAQCHHHPWERWGREDFYGLAGYFNGISRRKAGPDRDVIFQSHPRAMKIPDTSTVVSLRTLGSEPDEELAGDPRVPLARWMTSPENPWFARLVANRLWKHFLGRGLIEPEDDLRSTNPATNEPLLDYLEAQVIASKFDLKSVMQQIVTSRTYQLTSATNDTNYDDQQNYSHYTPKRLPAEVLLDAINAACGTSEALVGMPLGTRAIELWNNRLPSYFLEVFGRPERNSPCECVRSSQPTMAQALHLMNAPEIEEKLAAPAGRIAQLLDRGATQQEVVDELCLAALGRLPNEKERQVAAQLFAQGNKQQAAEDFLWAILNSYDFLFIR